MTRTTIKGSSLVLLANNDHHIQVILDEPPKQLHRDYIRRRTEHYLRYTPNINKTTITQHYATNTINKNAKSRIQFSGEDSDKIWQALLEPLDVDDLLEEQLGASSSSFHPPQRSR